MTEGERRIAELVAAGNSNKETAAALFLSVHTVEGALKRVYRKLGVHSRTELSRRLELRLLEQRPLIPGFRAFPLVLASGDARIPGRALQQYANPDSAVLARLGDGSSVRYLRSILIPGDETCLHLVEADSVEQVAEAFEQAGLEADRIVEAVGLQAPALLDNRRRKR